MDKTVRKLFRLSSHSYGLIIPKEYIKKYKWREKQKLIVEDKGRGRLQIRDWKE